ncbi:MAG: HEAT repeat domain-containing protein [Anaerolineae bacterium]|nr:HEAT repeat domain-containing protein [Gemmatimonadaceae bacterium]
MMLTLQVLSGAVPFLSGLLVKGLVILLVVAIAVGQLRRASASLRHAAWTAGIVSVLALPIALELGPRMHVASLAERVSQSVSYFSDAALTPIKGTSNESTIGSLSRSHGVLDGVSSGSTTALFPAGVDVAVLLFIVWLVGAVALTGRDIGRSVRAHRVVARSRVVRESHVLRLATGLRNRLRIQRPVLLVESDEVSGPATFGIFRPVVLLPTGAGSWPIENLHTVLAHELAHVARKDCLTDAIALAARNCHWLNPMAWIAVRRMRLERERACDDRVLEMGVRPEPYATLLLNVARAALHEPLAHGLSRTAALAMAAPLELESRLLAIFDPRLRRGGLRRGQRFALATLATAASVLIAALRLEAASGAPVSPADDAIGRDASGPVASLEFASRTERLAPAGKQPTQSDSATSTRGAVRLARTPSQSRASEPDTRQDSVAHPRSERVTTSRRSLEYALAGYEVARGGPDSLLAGRLRAQLDRAPEWEGDLVSERSAWALARVRDGRIIEPVVDELKNSDWRVRAYAAWVLEEAGASALRDSRATGDLIAALRHPVWRLRAMAAHALAGIREPSARAAMLEALDDEAWQVRVAAVHYVARLGDRTLLPELERLARDRHSAVRGAAAEALTANRTGE